MKKKHNSKAFFKGFGIRTS